MALVLALLLLWTQPAVGCAYIPPSAAHAIDVARPGVTLYATAPAWYMRETADGEPSFQRFVEAGGPYPIPAGRVAVLGVEPFAMYACAPKSTPARVFVPLI